MNEQDYLFYSYVGTWDENTLPFTRNYPNSVIFHPETKRIMHDGVIYGSGEGGPYFIKGTNNSNDTSGIWKGTHANITKYEEGISIIFVPNVEGSDTQTKLNINNLGDRNCYFTNNLALTQQYSVGTPILLTYVGTATTGFWKRADMDTTQTPVQLASTGTFFYFNLTDTTSGLTDIYTLGSNLYYNFTTKTMYCENFNGYLTGDISGNAGSATQLLNSHTLWGQSFDGTADVTGSISNTGNITPTTTKSYNIGGATLYYNQVFADYLRGRADGLYVALYTGTQNLQIVGQQENDIGISANTGKAYCYSNVYITKDKVLHSPYLRCGDSTAFNSTHKLFVSGQSKLDGNVTCTSNVYVTTSVGIGVTNTLGYKLYANGSGYILNDLYANAFIKHNGTSQEVLLADGTVKEWATTNTTSTIVARDSNGDIAGTQYYSDINDENISSIGSVYVTNGANDKAIRKVSYETFMAKTYNSQVISITKNLRVTIDWMDTGIVTNADTFPDGNGTYAIQVDATSINNSTDKYPSIYSGIMTVYNGTDNTTESEEIILHRSGKGTCRRLYLRTMPTASSSGYCKLQIATSGEQADPSNPLSGAFSQAYDIIFKFKKII